MKLLIRILGYGIITLFIATAMIYLANTNIIINELNECSSLAMSQTQTLMAKQIKDNLDLKETDLFTKVSYEDYYRKCFEELVDDSSIYNLGIVGDKTKGIIYVEIEVPKYKLIPIKKLLHIIDVEGEGLDDFESLYFEKTIETKTYSPGTQTDDFSPHVLASFPLTSDSKIHDFTSFTFDVYATNGTSTLTSSIAGPYIQVRCKDENDNIVIIDENHAGKGKHSKIKSSDKCSCKLLELVLPDGINQGDYGIKLNNLVIYRTSSVKEEVTTLTKKEGFLLSDFVDIKPRYINDINNLNEKSIWLQDDNYNNELKEYISKLK